jgi:hypothetical protein
LKLETYRVENNTFIKVGICGVLESRCRLVQGRFLNFAGDLESGWYPVQVEGLEKPILFSKVWVDLNSPLSEGETLIILLDTLDNKAWKIERTDMPLSLEPEQLTTSIKQTLQSSATYVPPGAGLEKTEEKRGKTIAD